MCFRINEKINWILNYCSEFPGHKFMYDERLEGDTKFNIDLGVENYIVTNIEDKNFILLTGDAGDGKTRTLNNLKEMLVQQNWRIVNDFSEHPKEEQMEIIEFAYDAIVNQKQKIIIAGNSGIFMNCAMEYEYNLLNKLKDEHNCLLINFRGRNLAKDEHLFSKLVKEFLNIEAYTCEENEPKCYSCKLNGKCPFKYNLKELNDEYAINSLRVIFDTLYLRGCHVTIRDLLSTLSYLVTKGYNCEELIDSAVELDQIYYYNNAFSYTENSNYLLKQLAKLDIAKRDFKELDFRFYKKYIKENNGNNTLSKIKSEKRRLYFKDPRQLKKFKTLHELLPIEYLSEYKIIIDRVKENGYLDSMGESLEIIRDFELGLNKISNPNHSEAQLVLFDSPPITSKDVRLEYSSDQQMRLMFCTPLFYSTDGENQEINSIDDLNNFFCFVYNDDYKSIKDCPVIKVDFKLFQLIMLAKDDIFTEKNIKLANNVHVQAFTKGIFDNIKATSAVSVTWTNKETKDLINFDISFIKASGFGQKKSKNKRILISRKGR